MNNTDHNYVDNNRNDYANINNDYISLICSIAPMQKNIFFYHREGNAKAKNALENK